ncbi:MULTISPECIES: hypothetical protein [unclassified Ruegeria]|uniref:hypothetical protein n=1 Tax=unclassified Ruegeria TaxID=2625375 RepID=UPI001ADB8C65|nr:MULTISPECIES: hypothetical protein [unclassified Ruegeria]MBO9412100.1 hypothetical protein [Ruegeria sp. R8_1]MBO9417209.1 hypothetical protein [Ruegeria sp. R8_2]
MSLRQVLFSRLELILAKGFGHQGHVSAQVIRANNGQVRARTVRLYKAEIEEAKLSRIFPILALFSSTSAKFRAYKLLN